MLYHAPDERAGHEEGALQAVQEVVEAIPVLLPVLVSVLNICPAPAEFARKKRSPRPFDMESNWIVSFVVRLTFLYM